MNDYIKREDAEKRLFRRAEIANSAYIDQTPSQIMMLAKNTVHLVPAADVRPVVRGKWEKRMEEKETPCYKSFTPIWFCSECGTEYDPSFCMTTNFCPNCGADMRKDGDT